MDLTSLVDDIRQTAAVSSLPSGQAEAECSVAVAAIPSAVKAVQKILQLTGDKPRKHVFGNPAEAESWA